MLLWTNGDFMGEWNIGLGYNEDMWATRDDMIWYDIMILWYDMIWYDIGVSEHEVEYTPHLTWYAC